MSIRLESDGPEKKPPPAAPDARPIWPIPLDARPLIPPVDARLPIPPVDARPLIPGDARPIALDAFWPDAARRLVWLVEGWGFRVEG